jgi:hypothetical protein
VINDVMNLNSKSLVTAAVLTFAVVLAILFNFYRKTEREPKVPAIKVVTEEQAQITSRVGLGDHQENVSPHENVSESSVNQKNDKIAAVNRKRLWAFTTTGNVDQRVITLLKISSEEKVALARVYREMRLQIRKEEADRRKFTRANEALSKVIVPPDITAAQINERSFKGEIDAILGDERAEIFNAAVEHCRVPLLANFGNLEKRIYVHTASGKTEITYEFFPENLPIQSRVYRDKVPAELEHLIALE